MLWEGKYCSFIVHHSPLTSLHPSPTTESLLTFQVPKALHILRCFQAPVTFFWFSWRCLQSQIYIYFFPSRQWVRLPSCMWACIQAISDWKGHGVMSGRFTYYYNLYTYLFSQLGNSFDEEILWSWIFHFFHMQCTSKKNEKKKNFTTVNLCNNVPITKFPWGTFPRN